MIKKKEGMTSVFHCNDIVLLSIPKKNLLSTESKRLPCKVLARVGKVRLLHSYHLVPY